MDIKQAKKIIERSFKSGGKYLLSREFSPDDMSYLIDILWDYNY